MVAEIRNQKLTPAWIMALGTFAIGTEGFMIVPLLPKMAEDLQLSIATLGTLVTVFTLTLAFSSPILTTLFGSVDRRRLLISTMGFFALANLVAWQSSGYWGIFAARVLLALAAGLYTPNANALISVLVAPEKRGRALAIVNGGMTIAIALGLPIGSLVGNALGWRVTFLGVGILALIAVVGLLVGLDRSAGSGIAVPGLAARIAVAKRPLILVGLAITLFWAIGAYTVWTYIAPYLQSVANFGPHGISVIVCLWGVSAAVGMFSGGALSDKFSAKAVMGACLALLTCAFLLLSFTAFFLSPAHAVIPIVISVAVWGVTVFGFFPAQMSHLIQVGGQASAPIVLSLNTSSMYGGFALGSAIGSVVVSQGRVADLGLAAALAEVIGLILLYGFAARTASPSTSPAR
ncbi:putative MFS family arabinose efflux permease [Rhizobium azooxidifex]|uniref:Putative MFS family arabinose efflux permease n=1 Tax=Mycoplana azooxidifex TaxID=1636188 RepID=A0A7W6DH55_9HYPH|nr:MFS transporter [Mycoplana azooxidifex]MBB3979708.1 putative MFS family arabinose efflux permease [Mycoplana azooxidifex]